MSADIAVTMKGPTNISVVAVASGSRASAPAMKQVAPRKQQPRRIRSVRSGVAARCAGRMATTGRKKTAKSAKRLQTTIISGTVSMASFWIASVIPKIACAPIMTRTPRAG